jgi:alpha-tubulin suppressor-like RCC1 family protein
LSKDFAIILQIFNKGVCMTFLTAKFGTLSSFGLKFFLGLFVSFLLVGCGDESKTAVAAGGGHSLVLDKDGNVYGAGDSSYGQLGLGNVDCRVAIVYYCKAFTKISSLEDKNITAIAAGYVHSFAIDKNGNVYVSGDNDNGQLGLGDHDGRDTFTKISLFDGKNIIVVAAGHYHSLALGSGGKVYAAGWNSGGQLGLGDAKYYNGFTEVSSLGGKNIIAITAGYAHSLVLGSDGKVYAAGDNSEGQLGLGDKNNRNIFTEVSSLGGKNIVAIYAGYTHSLALGDDGKVYAAGHNSEGQLGLGDSGYGTDRNSFTEVSSLNGKRIIAISAGIYHSLAIDSDGKVYATGWNLYGQLGFGDRNSRNTFGEVPSLKGKNIVAIAAGSGQSFAVGSDGKIYASGDNSYGHLGLGDTKERQNFTEITR